MTELASIERTALLTAALRAAETARPDSLYSDPYAAAFAGDTGPSLLAEVRAATFPPDRPRTLPSTPDYNAIRTRFFDDFLVDTVRSTGIRQVVLAPAGMDSRAFRLQWPEGVRVFEVDRPVVVGVKEEILGGAEPVVDRVVVGADLRDHDWAATVCAAGYDPTEPSLWLLEGLLYYIPEADTRRILAQVRAHTVAGSVVAADIVNAAALTLPNMRGLLDVFASWGCPWVFGSDSPEELFAEYGVRATATQPGDPGADYGRWPDAVPDRSVSDVRRVFFVTGTRED